MLKNFNLKNTLIPILLTKFSSILQRAKQAVPKEKWVATLLLKLAIYPSKYYLTEKLGEGKACMVNISKEPSQAPLCSQAIASFTPMLIDSPAIIIAGFQDLRIPNMSLVCPVSASYNYINRKDYFFSVIMRTCRLQWQACAVM